VCVLHLTIMSEFDVSLLVHGYVRQKYPSSYSCLPRHLLNFLAHFVPVPWTFDFYDSHMRDLTVDRDRRLFTTKDSYAELYCTTHPVVIDRNSSREYEFALQFQSRFVVTYVGFVCWGLNGTIDFDYNSLDLSNRLFLDTGHCSYAFHRNYSLVEVTKTDGIRGNPQVLPVVNEEFLSECFYGFAKGNYLISRMKENGKQIVFEWRDASEKKMRQAVIEMHGEDVLPHKSVWVFVYYGRGGIRVVY